MQPTTHSNTTAVYQCLISPLSAAFGPNRGEFNRELVKRMEGFSRETLESAADTLIESCKRRPAIADILEACKRGKSYGHTVSAPPFEAVGYIEKANNAMKTVQGKHACREGWGSDYWLHVKDGGDEDLTVEQVTRFKDGLVKSKQAFMRLETPEFSGNQFTPMLRRLWHSMQNRNQELARAYA